MQSLLARTGARFKIPFTVVEGGSGVVEGTLTETDQTSQPSYVFVKPRHVLRTPVPTALRTGMVIQSPDGLPFIVGDNGPSETYRGTLWYSFRVFEPTGRYLWQRRSKVTDPVTKLPKDSGQPENLGTFWMAIEAIDRELTDFAMREFIEQSRFITGQPVKDGDIIDNRAVSKVDLMLGLYIGFLN